MNKYTNSNFESPVVKPSKNTFQSDQRKKSSNKLLNKHKPYSFTPNGLSNIKLISSTTSTPEDLKQIFSPPPGFNIKYDASRKLEFVDEVLETHEKDANLFKSVKFCENCGNLNTLDFYQAAQLKEIIIGIANDFKDFESTSLVSKLRVDEATYTQHLQDFTRKMGLKHAKEAIELSKKYSQEISALKNSLESLAKTLNKDLVLKDTINRNLVSIIHKYDPGFKCPYSIQSCTGCLKLAQEVNSKSYQINELQDYIKKFNQSNLLLTPESKQKCAQKDKNDPRGVNFPGLTTRDSGFKTFKLRDCKDFKSCAYRNIIKIEIGINRLQESEIKSNIIESLTELTVLLKELFDFYKSSSVL